MTRKSYICHCNVKILAREREREKKRGIGKTENILAITSHSVDIKVANLLHTFELQDSVSRNQ